MADLPPTGNYDKAARYKSFRNELIGQAENPNLARGLISSPP